MKFSFLATAVVLAMAASATACEAHAQQASDVQKTETSDAQKAESPATQPSAEPVNQMCAVEQEHKADPKVTHTYQEKVYAFCCKDCIETFKLDPEKYKNAK